MKLFGISLFLLLAAAVSARLFTVPAIPPVHPPRRLTPFVYDADRLKEDLDAVLGKYGWTVHPLAPTSFMVKVKIGNQLANFFEVSLTETQPETSGAAPAYIVVSNLPKKTQDPTFARFHKHKIFSRQTPSEIPGANAQFLTHCAEKFHQAFRTTLDHSAVPTVFKNVQQMITQQGVQNVVMIERGSTLNSVLFDLNSKSSGKMVAQAVVYSISDDYVGLSLAQKDDLSFFNLPVDNLEGANPDLLRVLTEKAANIENKLTLADVKKRIEDKIRSLCPTNIPEIESISATPDRLVWRINRSGQTMGATPDTICPYLDADIFVTHFSHGYMQYFHLCFNSRFLREEYIMSTLHEKFDLNLEKALQMIKSDTQLAHKSLRENKAEVELKGEDLKEVLEKGIGETSIDSPFSDEDKAGCAASGNKCFAQYSFPNQRVIVKLFLNRDGWVISATRWMPRTNTPFSVQLTTSLKSTGSQKPAILQHIQNFMTSN